MRDEALKALLEERWQVAAAKYGLRLLKDPDDAVARSNRAVALYESGQWLKAARAFQDVLRREGPASEVAAPALFSLGYCLLELQQDRASLQATTLFLELSSEDHPFFWDGVQNLACACHRLGHSAPAVQLYRVVLGVRPHAYAYNGLALSLANLGRAREAIYVLDRARGAGHWDEVLQRTMEHVTQFAQAPAKATPITGRPWSRERILGAAFQVLGWKGKPLPRSRRKWRNAP